MKKIFLFLPAILLMACGNQSTETAKVEVVDTVIADATLTAAVKSDEEILNSATADTVGAEIIGRWKDSAAMRSIVLYKIDRQYMVRWVYPGGIHMDKKLNFKADEYIVADTKFDEWYVIYDDGTLGTFNNNGKISDSVKL